jgi:hypothetical protein
LRLGGELRLQRGALFLRQQVEDVKAERLLGLGRDRF